MSTIDTASEYVKQQRSEAKKHAEFDQQLVSIGKSVIELPESLLPPERLMNTIGSHDRAHFLHSSVGFFHEFVRRGNLTSDSTVLDIGSGCGRMALPFEIFLQGGSYHGVDVWPEGVQWCSDNISARSGKMAFHLLSAENNYYFDDYKQGVENSFSLPFLKDAELDFAFAISVFTHLLESDTRAYFRELARTLKPGAVAFVTGFIIDYFFWKHVAATGKHKHVKEIDQGVFQAYAGQDFFVGYSMGKWRAMLQESGLDIICYETGSWAGKPGARSFQDTFIVLRADTYRQ
jgi:SAM-dependent methyltransferase